MLWVSVTPLDGELAVVSHWVEVKQLVILVIFIAIGITLSGCKSPKPDSRNREWNQSFDFDWGEHDDLFDWDRD